MNKKTIGFIIGGVVAFVGINYALYKFSEKMFKDAMEKAFKDVAPNNNNK